MSTVPDNEFDLEKLFLPAWAQQEPSSTKYAKYEGEEARAERRGDRHGPRPPRRDGGPGGRREGGGPRGERRGPSRGGPEGGRPAGADRGERGPRREFRRGEGGERREPPPPLPELELTLVPEEKGVESLARQIKMTGRAFPLFDIAQMILQKPERHTVEFRIKKNAEGRPVQPLFACALDDTLWLSEDDAVRHILKKHFNTFYQAERTATEPPKGKYTFVAQCGMSGTILGPPNYHDYQNQLRKLHAERFSRLPFDVFKARVKIVRDEAVVKKWVEDQSWKTEYLCLNMPEPLRLGSLEAVEKHFRENHKDNIIKPVEAHTLGGSAARSLQSPDLARLVRSVWEDQRRFPLQIATVLSQQFAGHGLQFFKVNKTITHVSVARPHFLDMTMTPVSEGVQRIVDYINANLKCTRRKLLDALAPAPAVIAVPQPAATAEGAAAAPAPAPQTVEPSPEQNAVIGDLHWLIHQGHVIEFANGTLETAKKPLPRPPKPEPKPAEKPTEDAAPPAPTAVTEATAPETAPLEGQTTPQAAVVTEPPGAPETGPAETLSPQGGSNEPAPVPLPEAAAPQPAATATEPPVEAPAAPVPSQL